MSELTAGPFGGRSDQTSLLVAEVPIELKLPRLTSILERILNLIRH